jgi:hypothetical protein
MVDDMGTTLRTVYTGQFLATVIIPEPSSLLLLTLGALSALLSVRQRK